MRGASSKDHSGGAASRRRGSARAVRLNEILPSGLKTGKVWTSLPVLLAIRQAQVLAETLAAVGLPAAILSAAGHVLAANKLFAALKPEIIQVRSGRPQFTDQVADQQICEVVGRIDHEPSGEGPHAISIRGNKGEQIAIAHLIVVRDDEGETFAGICGILVVVPLQSAPNPMSLQRLFGLSPAETRVACGIAGRQTIEAIADDFGVSRETVRSQLKTVLVKTGTKRQLDLAVLLLGLQLPRI